MSNKFKVVDLFAGAGGLSKAFQQAGADIIWANEIDKYACILYRENFKDVYLAEGDIKDIRSENIPDFDILIGGFPCQSFSIAGKSRWLDNEKGNLFFEIIRLLKVKKPRAILLEGVKGLKSHDNGRTLKIITEELQGAGYLIKNAVLNSMEYGNIPHNKERMYIVGFRELKGFEMFEFPQKVKMTNMLSDIINLSEIKSEKYYTGKSIDILKESKGGKIDKGIIYQLRYSQNKKEKYIISEHDFCPALTLYISKREHIPIIKDNFDTRLLTLDECFSFQGFCDIKIPKMINDHMLYRYAANCSSVTVVESIARNLVDVLSNKEELNDERIDSSFKMNINSNTIKCPQKTLSQAIPDSLLDILENKNLISSKIETVVEKTTESNTGIVSELSDISPGNDDANRFHDYITEVITKIFSSFLSRPQKEVKIYEGRKRVDILFDNLAEKGFFYELKNNYHVYCPKIIIECKNYSSIPSNPEFDQLIGRFNNNIGKFGILICRKIDNKKSILSKCKDVLNGRREYIMVLCDNDIEKLLKLHMDNDIEGINNFLRSKFDEIIL